MPGPSWDDIRVFLAVEREGSFTAAARELGMDPSTVGRRITALEEALSARLFDRTPQGPRVTAIGAEVLGDALGVEAHVSRLRARAANTDHTPSGKVVVTAAPIFADTLIAPALPQLWDRFPDIDVDLVSTTDAVSLPAGTAEVALRLRRESGAAGPPAALAKRLGTIHVVPCAHERYLERRPVVPERGLAGHAVVGYNERAPIPLFDDLLSKHGTPSMRVPLSTNSMMVTVSAVRAGLAVGLLLDVLVPLYAGVRVVGPSVHPAVAWLVTLRELRHTARVAAVFDWLAEMMVAAIERAPDGVEWPDGVAPPDAGGR